MLKYFQTNFIVAINMLIGILNPLAIKTLNTISGLSGINVADKKLEINKPK